MEYLNNLQREDESFVKCNKKERALDKLSKPQKPPIVTKADEKSYWLSDCSADIVSTLISDDQQIDEQSTNKYVPSVQLYGKKGGQMFIKLKCTQAISGLLTLILDTGSTVSIIRAEKLKGLTVYHPNKRLKLVGIAGVREGIGATQLMVAIGRKTIPIEFQLVQGEPPDDCDGILGMNFTQKCVIDCLLKKLRYYDNEHEEKKGHIRLVGKIIKGTDQMNQPHVQSEEHTKCEISLDPWKQGAKLYNEMFTTQNKEKTKFQLLADTADATVQEFIDNINVSNDEEICNYVKETNTPSVKAFMVSRGKDFEQVASTDESRTERVMQAFKHEHLTERQDKKLKELFEAYSEVFMLKGDKLPATTAMKLNIPLVTKEPIFTKQYNLCPTYREAALKQALEWEAEGIVSPSVSPFNSPVLVVEKKTTNPDGSKKLRVCCDLRKINTAVVKTFHHLPAIHTLLRDIGKAKFFTVIDLSQGYLAIPVCQTDRHKLAFTAGHRRFEFNRMPFGYVSAGYCFTTMINKVLGDLLINNRIWSYLDDIIIAADTEEEMLDKIEKILKKFRQFDLRINPEKIEILCNSVNFLGHIISEQGISPAKDKIAAISRCKPPKDVKSVLSFIACSNFFKQFIPEHSALCEPMLALVRKTSKGFVWTEECQKSFEAIKMALTKPPLLAHFSELEIPGNKTVLMTDASQYSTGACLAVLSKEGMIKPIAYTSRTLTKSERNWSTYDREMFAIIVAVTDSFKYMLLGRHFWILTDHRPLAQMNAASLDVIDGKMLRWRIKLERFSFKIMYIPGEHNAVADALSRLEHDETFDEEEQIDRVLNVPSYAVTTRAMRNSTINDESGDTQEGMLDLAVRTAREVDAEFESGDEEMPYELQTGNPKKINDRGKQTELIRIYHEHPMVGHLGVKKGYMRLSKAFTWPKQKQQYEEFVRNCEVCQRCKTKNRNVTVPAGEVEMSDKSFNDIFVDLVGPFEPPSPEGFKYILSAQCATTRFAVSVGIANRETDTIAKTLFEDVFLTYSFPRTLWTDNAAELTSEVIKKLMKLIKVRKNEFTIYRPNANICERYQGSLKMYLKCFLAHDKVKSNWGSLIKLATYSFNVSPHTRTGFAPFTLIYGHPTNDPITSLSIPVVYSYENYYDDVRRRIKLFHEVHRERVKKSIEKDRKKHDVNSEEKTFIPGEKVLVKKFVKGPLEEAFDLATVIEDKSTQNVLLKRKNKTQLIHKDNVQKFNKRDSFPETTNEFSDVTDAPIASDIE